MKTPKEYAVELVEDFNRYTSGPAANFIDMDSAKACAKLAVNEVLDALEQIDSNHPAIDEMYQRYKLIKEEIQKL